MELYIVSVHAHHNQGSFVKLLFQALNQEGTVQIIANLFAVENWV